MTLLHDGFVFLGRLVQVNLLLQVELLLVEWFREAAGPHMYFLHELIENVVLDLVLLAAFLRLVNFTSIFADDHVRLLRHHVSRGFQV